MEEKLKPLAKTAGTKKPYLELERVPQPLIRKSPIRKCAGTVFRDQTAPIGGAGTCAGPAQILPAISMLPIESSIHVY